MNVSSPIGGLKAIVSFGNRSMQDNFNIYESVSGVLLSWRTAKSLGILPPNYAEHLPVIPDSPMKPGVQSIYRAGPKASGNIRPLSKKELMKEFPDVLMARSGRYLVRCSRSRSPKVPNPSEPTHLKHCLMHTWSQPNMSLNCLGHWASSQAD